VILTHGHWDHSGSALELAKEWDVPIYAHPLELPYLTGKSRYAPKDPTVGGAIAMAARLMPSKGYDFGDRIQALPGDGTVPGMPGWQWVHTPGHTHGHVSLFRERDRVVLAGDALTTVNQDSPYTAITRRPEFYRPPAPFTVDWTAAEASIHNLATLHPSVVGAGHGWPIKGSRTAELLAEFAAGFGKPERGRYVNEPVVADETGIVSLPPPVPDYTGRMLAVWAVAGVAGVAAFTVYHQMKKRREREQAKSQAPATTVSCEESRSPQPDWPDRGSLSSPDRPENQ
jgi:glyoxylase-like metal-dependent hydrolase (beta-lactamase superfamily II)